MYKSQEVSSHPGDWVCLIGQDKITLGLELTDEEIVSLSKIKSKNMVKKKVERYALMQLNESKRKHSKSQYLNSSSFETAQYLVDNRFSKAEAQLLFKLRSKTLNLKMNFPQQFQDNLCKTCKLFPESQNHLLQCPKIVPRLKLLELQQQGFCDEKFIYSGINNQLKIVKIYIQILEIRTSILETEDE